MSSHLLKHLNAAQKNACICTDGPIVILAGAGSGKTRVLIYKVAHLILEKNISPDNILMVTFTNKAANEMKERISKLILSNQKDHCAQLPHAGTFHSFCAKLLRKEGKHISILPNFVIYDQQDQKDAIKEAMARLDFDNKFSPASFAITISQAKNELISSTEYPQYAYGYFQKEASKVYLEYQKILRENNALDFDDLLSETVKLFLHHEEVIHYYQNKYRYILIDEYQDTNHAQYTLSKLLAKKHKNICVVGDASQSIYSWRGADFKNINNFKRDYPTYQEFHLEQNYRSTQIILDASFNIISNNKMHPVLKLWTEKPNGEPITIHQTRNELNEADFVINRIQEIRYESPKTKYSDFAVLYRINAQSRVIEEALLHYGIPYILVGGVRFYERKEVKDIISYLRLLANPSDKISYRRAEKIGKKRLEKFLVFQNEFQKKLSKNNITTLDILDMTLEITSYLDKYNPDNPEDQNRLENIKEMRSVATQFPHLIQFLENISLVEMEYLPDISSNRDIKKDAITLMTMHAAKGLEFNTVFMIGMEEGLFPHSRSLFDASELEEERRLCYVGMTRAKERLLLTHARQRLFFGQKNTNQISRFIMEIPEHLTLFTKNDHI
ncbi:ATP-dependent DNA helicase PcrA [Candidatus Gottesmanbacteria bacterium CG11_big_fil_rev_8_21_14_0_20_37_11]|uniref:DNA 3'-5' helicase n=3 Tax=Candidatus Gottesmaniibacteriota TaxID=1752720 RepID=A0A2M7RTB4_9BACT|nr:MAG: hypothetical protein AUJ73_03955 [Candidatus Gottesmanbacteria bacterium CG1_02_37_22]PIP32683.1 MAG: ATP-dependent DNA helicase PcrA [Candidatus Gottesmanbacteria bacterium CG23_combo_of_CG06-09_8_20_14_all_37_19]PIR08562.1 MAG: ATP-dependent DNA helicase PcrA [Candidatus Gottesmanbacteria bacterium CG11_big_fil_rev_8_21_14_0_20_37_11]PIZ03214.1 MAG: ATP-dependent DNA helicase PcrA [Candidatus Gottesmanbacteria bacterium CG_4_10_14_0_8_um_filter_37_24]